MIPRPTRSRRSARPWSARDPDRVAPRLRRLPARYRGLRVSDRTQLTRATDEQRESQRWLNRLPVLVIFAFTSIAVVNTLVIIALQRGRELALLRLVGATSRQVVSMTRWEAALIVLVGLGLGLGAAISLATLIQLRQPPHHRRPRPAAPDRAAAAGGE